MAFFIFRAPFAPAALLAALRWPFLFQPSSRPCMKTGSLIPQLKAIAAAHHGKLAVYAHNLKTGQTASLRRG
jgi:branched-subunit amino acid transport protein